MARFLRIDGSTNIDLRTYLLNLDKITSVYNTGASTVQIAYQGNFPEGQGVLQVIEIECSVPFAQETPEDNFAIHPKDFLKARSKGKLQYIVHSHPEGGDASEPDKKACTATKIPWYVYLIPQDTWQTINP